MKLLELFIPKSIIQINTIFISILIEAIPFVLLGVFISGIIQMFVTEEMIKKWIPKNRFLAILVGALFGCLFPACECGIVPIARRLIIKGVPVHTAIPFMITGPVVNPIVLFSTYVAFGDSIKMALERGIVAFVIAIAMGAILSVVYKNKTPFKTNEHTCEHEHHDHDHDVKKLSLTKRFFMVMEHAIDEFFYMGKYLIFGGIIAASVQVLVSTDFLSSIGHGRISSTFVMMGLSYFLSLCSEADAFVGSSFRFTFTNQSIIAFLVFGAMIDVKNTIMMFSSFKAKFVFIYIGLAIVLVFIGTLFL